jgi:hypothetical protein
MTHVRIATRDDEPGLIRLLEMMHAESGMFDLDNDAMKQTFARAFNREGGLIGVIGPSNDIQAGLYLLITKFWYTTQDHLEDLFNFVRPDHRKSDYADTLIKFGQDCADKIGIPLILGVLTNRRVEAKVRLYRRRLGVPVGAVFAYNAHWVNEDAIDTDFWRVHSRSRKQKKSAEPTLLEQMNGARS